MNLLIQRRVAKLSLPPGKHFVSVSGRVFKNPPPNIPVWPTIIGTNGTLEVIHKSVTKASNES